MQTLDYIPTNKIKRATKLVATGVRVGGNYLKYFGRKALNREMSKEALDEENAKDIYDGLKSLKGSALKVAQMLSMEKNVAKSIRRAIQFGAILGAPTFCPPS